MPVVKEREYRQMFQPLMIPQGRRKRGLTPIFTLKASRQRLINRMLCTNTAGSKYYEVIDRNALVGADLSDVIMQFDHSGMVFARNKMAKNKPPSLLFRAAGKRLVYCGKFEPYGRSKAPICKH